MESSNLHHLHHQQQLQEELLNIQSSSLATTTIPSSSSCYALGTSTTPPSWSSNHFILNSSGSYSPSTNGAMLNSRDPNIINASAMNNNVHQDLGFHWAIKDDELISSDSVYPKFTDMINRSPSSSIEDLHLQNNNNNNSNFNMMNEKVLLRNFSSGCQIDGLHLPTPDFYSGSDNTNNSTSSSAPGRGTFSQIFPTINISNFSQSPNSNLGMNLEALDLFNSSRFNNSLQPSHDHLLSGLPYTAGTTADYLSHDTRSTTPTKRSTFSTTGATEAKRRSSFMEPTKAPQAAPKKSRLDSRASCPPFKVRKEKLGDRIAALQQLVAPFGKTDTASVLMEAIGYIKFLQNQVETLSVPYMKSSRNKTTRSIMQGVDDGQGGNTDLRSRGLCLVPLSCLSYVTDGGGGVWAPPEFGGAT